MQIRRRRALALAVADEQFDLADALALGAIVVPARRQAKVDGRRFKRLVHLLRMIGLRHLDRAAAAVMCGLSAPARFQPLEIGQHVRVAPAGQALLPPEIVIAAVSARENHPVDRRGAAQRLAPPQRQRAPVDAGVRLGLETPGVVLVPRHLDKCDRQLDPRMRVAPARFQQQDFSVLVLGQAVRQHASGRAGADNDVVVGCHADDFIS